MGRKRKYQITRFEPNTPGTVSHERKTLVAEIFGEVNSSGDIYISKDLARCKTVTYAFKRDETTDKPVKTHKRKYKIEVPVNKSIVEGEDGDTTEQVSKQGATRKKTK